MFPRALLIVPLLLLALIVPSVATATDAQLFATDACAVQSVQAVAFAPVAVQRQFSFQRVVVPRQRVVQQQFVVQRNVVQRNVIQRQKVVQPVVVERVIVQRQRQPLFQLNLGGR